MTTYVTLVSNSDNLRWVCVVDVRKHFWETLLDTTDNMIKMIDIKK